MVDLYAGAEEDQSSFGGTALNDFLSRCFMVDLYVEQKRIKAVLVAPPCTTFSPAAYPPVRSYRNPPGFIRSLWKV